MHAKYTHGEHDEVRNHPGSASLLVPKYFCGPISAELGNCTITSMYRYRVRQVCIYMK